MQKERKLGTCVLAESWEDKNTSEAASIGCIRDEEKELLAITTRHRLLPTKKKKDTEWW